MFLKTAGFKKIIKEAYKGVGLKIGNTGSGIYLSGGYWVIWVRKGHIPKEKLAAIIELIGELPEAGIAFSVTSDGQQYELQWNDLYSAMENATNCDCEMDITKIMIENKHGTVTRVLQRPGIGAICMINEKFISMIDNGAVDDRNGHTQAEGPLCGPYPGVFWMNNVMALHVLPIVDDDLYKLVKYLEGININESTVIPQNPHKEEAEEA